MFSKIRRVFGRIGSFIKKHPIAALVIFLIIITAGSVAAYETMHYTSSPKFCKLCHPKEGTGPDTEYYTWTKSIHSFYGIECIDCHSKRPGLTGYIKTKVQDGLADLVMAFAISKEHKIENLSRYIGDTEASAKLVPVEICLHCHSDKINKEHRKKYFMTFFGLAMRELDTVEYANYRDLYDMPDLLKDKVTNGVEPNHAVHINLEVPCVKCHGSPTHSGEFHTKSNKLICFTCHDEMRAGGHNPADNDDCVRCHEMQANLQEGTVAEKYGVTGERWYMADIGCESCHPDPFVRLTKEHCANCHDDDYPDIMEAFQQNYEVAFEAANSFYKEILAELPRITPEKRSIIVDYRKLLNIAERDGSRSVHNPDYMSAIFDRLSELEQEYRE